MILDLKMQSIRMIMISNLSKNLKRLLIMVTTLLCSQGTFGYCYDVPSSCCSSCYREWSALFYIGKMTKDNLGQVLVLDYTLDRDTLYSFEIAKELDYCNAFRRFFQPVVNSIDLRANFTLLDDTYGTIYEFNPYFTLNWYQFPWCRQVKTTFSFGEGLSYVSKVPYTEEKNSDESRKLLNFLLFEVAFAAPCHPEWEIIARVHHRSGAFGIYHANNAGSTAIGIALRYHFPC